MSSRIEAVVLVASLLAISAAGCVAPPQQPPPRSVAVTDGDGNTVNIVVPVERIVSLTPSHTEVLFAIGAGPRVVGGTDFDTYPPEASAVPDVLTNLQVNFEKVVTLDPDIVFVSSLNAAADIAHLRELNLTVFFADAYAVFDVPPMIEMIGRAVQEEANATAVAETLRASLGATADTVANGTGSPRVFYLLDDYGAFWTSGTGTRGNDLIELAGGTNIFSNASGWASVSLEAVVAADPEVIIIGLYVSLGQDQMNNTAPWSNMTAVEDGRVYRVPDADLLDRPGPRLSEGAEWMARAIHPEAFA
jgi:iron complex transport system substrate-binding protein